MIEVEMVVRIPKMWLTELPRRHEVSIRVLSRRPEGAEGVRDLVEFIGPQDELEEVLRELEEEPWVKEFNLDFVEPGRLIGEVVTHKCLACAMLAGSKTHLISARANRDGSVRWHLMTSDRRNVRKLMDSLKRAKFHVKLEKITPIDVREGLTRRQEEIIMMAYDRGYFETPRKVKLKELSRLTGVTEATLSEILRKGQKKILDEYLRAHRKAE